MSFPCMLSHLPEFLVRPLVMMFMTVVLAGERCWIKHGSQSLLFVGRESLYNNWKIPVNAVPAPALPEGRRH